jgi:hypothetical protein
MEDSCGRPMFRSGMMGLLIDTVYAYFAVLKQMHSAK